MSPLKPSPSSDQAAVDGSTGTPRSTSERRGEVPLVVVVVDVEAADRHEDVAHPELAASRAMYELAPTPARARSPSLLLLSIDCGEALEPVLGGRLLLDLELGQALELELEHAADPIGDRGVTAQDEPAKGEAVADLGQVGGFEARRAVGADLDVAEPGRFEGREGRRERQTAAPPSGPRASPGRARRPPARRVPPGRPAREPARAALFLVSSNSCFKIPTCSSSALSFCSISSGEAPRARGTRAKKTRAPSNKHQAIRDCLKVATSSSVSAGPWSGPFRSVGSLPGAISPVGGWLVRCSLREDLPLHGGEALLPRSRPLRGRRLAAADASYGSHPAGHKPRLQPWMRFLLVRPDVNPNLSLEPAWTGTPGGRGQGGMAPPADIATPSSSRRRRSPRSAPSPGRTAAPRLPSLGTSAIVRRHDRRHAAPRVAHVLLPAPPAALRRLGQSRKRLKHSSGGS